MGAYWLIRNGKQLQHLVSHLRGLTFPYQLRVSEPTHPKTTPQIRYMHSLCNALAAHHKAKPEDAKRDCKVEFGVVIVSTSLVTGDRTARLKSFADYTREESQAFCTAMEAHLDSEGIEYVRADDVA